MKELSIEESAKAYTELINRLEDVKDAIKKQNYGIAMDILYKPYPQFQITTYTKLEEGEGERIRENIIATIHLYYGEPLEDEAKEMIAWLEKQRGQKDILEDAVLDSNKDGLIADTIQPKLKFKVGDWIVYNDNIYHICNISLQTYYECLRVDGTVHTFVDIDSKSHLWTIQDAKAGDVLSYRNGQWIFILKRIIDKDSFEYYTLWSTIHNDLTINDSAFSLLINSIYPATKEQRDLLFQKIHEAGYEWDSEKKELKKIEQKPWSEEDEMHIRELESLVKQVWATAEHENDKNTIHKMSDLSFFLKTLKPQLKQEWSEEDETKIKSIIALLKSPALCTMDGNKGIIDESIKYLKSLKERYTWKPSEEQMDAIKDAIDYLGGNTKIVRKHLMSLYEQLKKLKG